MVARVTFISFRVFLEGCHGWYSSKPILVRSRQVSLISEAHPCWSAGFEILCMSEPLFLITYSRVCKQDTLSHHFIQPSCKYFGSHQLCLDRKHLARVTTATVSTSEAKMSKFIVSWDFWVINTRCHNTTTCKPIILLPACPRRGPRVRLRPHTCGTSWHL